MFERSQYAIIIVEFLVCFQKNFELRSLTAEKIMQLKMSEAISHRYRTADHWLSACFNDSTWKKSAMHEYKMSRLFSVSKYNFLSRVTRCRCWDWNSSLFEDIIRALLMKKNRTEMLHQLHEASVDRTINDISSSTIMTFSFRTSYLAFCFRTSTSTLTFSHLASKHRAIASTIALQHQVFENWFSKSFYLLVKSSEKSKEITWEISNRKLVFKSNINNFMSFHHIRIIFYINLNRVSLK